MFHNWSLPQMFCRHQTVPETQPTTSSDYYNTICKTYVFWHTGVEGKQKSFVSIDSRNHNNIHQLTNIVSTLNEMDSTTLF